MLNTTILKRITWRSIQNLTEIRQKYGQYRYKWILRSKVKFYWADMRDFHATWTAFYTELLYRIVWNSVSNLDADKKKRRTDGRFWSPHQASFFSERLISATVCPSDPPTPHLHGAMWNPRNRHLMPVQLIQITELRPQLTLIAVDTALGNGPRNTTALGFPPCLSF